MAGKVSLVNAHAMSETHVVDDRRNGLCSWFHLAQSLRDVSMLGCGWQALKPVLPPTDVHSARIELGKRQLKVALPS